MQRGSAGCGHRRRGKGRKRAPAAGPSAPTPRSSSASARPHSDGLSPHCSRSRHCGKGMGAAPPAPPW
ncbi:hypothetical protein BRADI_1g69136v3 [Brachypodium distachyon]|uniref:Uncharacterized protein n=1 Tax=Brachypodium distachyon TaxID=15368 RepID=A0A2K2DU55_BRADI|nr:hypothetical protein BRADI_1g69136v3 [Brachypodium distachyon]